MEERNLNNFLDLVRLMESDLVFSMKTKRFIPLEKILPTELYSNPIDPLLLEDPKNIGITLTEITQILNK